MAQGYVYILLNPSLPGLVKIGQTTRNPFERAAELQTTGVPTPFIVLAALRVDDVAGAETALHTHFANQRVADSREFFRVSPQEAARTLLSLPSVGGVDDGISAQPALSNGLDGESDMVARAERMLESGESFNPSTARKLLTQASKDGSAKAALLLGNLYSGGRGVTPNKAKAKAEYTIAFERGCIEAALPLYRITGRESYLFRYIMEAQSSDEWTNITYTQIKSGRFCKYLFTLEDKSPVSARASKIFDATKSLILHDLDLWTRGVENILKNYGKSRFGDFSDDNVRERLEKYFDTLDEICSFYYVATNFGEINPITSLEDEIKALLHLMRSIEWRLIPYMLRRESVDVYMSRKRIQKSTAS